MVLTGKTCLVERSTRPISSGIFGLVTVALLLLAVHFQGLGTFTIGEKIDISLTDIAIITLGYIWLIYALGVRLHVSRTLVVTILLASLFTIWIGIQAFRSPEPVRGITMFLLLLRDIAVLWLIGSTLGSIRDVHRLNKVVFLIGIVIAALSLTFYLLAMRDYQDILSNPARWKPKTIYELGQAGILRLQGFAGDPNFYSLWISASLFCGFGITGVRRLWKWLGIAVIGASILLTFSRGFLVAFGASFVLIVFWLGLTHAKVLWRRYAKPILVSMLVMSMIALIPLPFMQGSAAKLLIARFQLTATTPRFGMWEKILGELPSQLLLGKGLRAAELSLGGMYSHNSYIDLLFETGLVGFILWVFFALFVTVKSFGTRNAELLPWLHTWILTFFMLLFFSLLYNPFLWLLSAILVGLSRREALSE